MLRERKTAAEQLASRLYDTETAIDAAISKMADLAGHMPVARSNANLSAVVGQDAIAQAAQTFAVLVEARGQIVETHHRLAEAQSQIGLKEMAVGGQGEKPPVVQGNKTLTLVEEAA